MILETKEELQQEIQAQIAVQITQEHRLSRHSPSFLEERFDFGIFKVVRHLGSNYHIKTGIPEWQIGCRAGYIDSVRIQSHRGQAVVQINHPPIPAAPR